MAAPTSADVADYLGTTVDANQANAVIGVVTSMASAYTRGVGFDTNGEPNADLSAVILSGAARLLSNTAGVESENMGPFSVRYGAGFSWTVAEKYVLDRYRKRAE
jgi:hypothetical protein